MRTTIPNGRDQFQRHPQWNDRCQDRQCRHIASSHGPTETTNNVGKCRVGLCGCSAFRFPMVVNR